MLSNSCTNFGIHFLSQSARNARNASKNNLITAKLQLFCICCRSSWTLSYKVSNRQTYGISCIYDIKNIICNILEIIVKPEVLVKIKKPHKLKDIDLSNKNNLIKPGEMGIGFAVDCEVKKLKQKDAVNLTDIKEFKKAAQKFIVAMAENDLKEHH